MVLRLLLICQYFEIDCWYSASIYKNITNLSIKEGFFLDKLKFSEVGPIFKKKDDLKKEN